MAIALNNNTQSHLQHILAQFQGAQITPALQAQVKAAVEHFLYQKYRPDELRVDVGIVQGQLQVNIEALNDSSILKSDKRALYQKYLSSMIRNYGTVESVLYYSMDDRREDIEDHGNINLRLPNFHMF